MISKTANDSMLNQNLNPNFKLKKFFAIKSCIMHVANCTHKLVNAAPLASNIGINIKFNVRFIITPIAATIFNCLRFPLAVNKVPKIYVTDIETKLPIKICNIFEDSEILILYVSIDSFGWMLYNNSIRL